MFVRGWTMFLVCCVGCGLAEAAPERDPLEESLSWVYQEWGKLGIDTAAHAPGKTGRPLQIGSRHYEKGIGTHANSRLVVDLSGDYASFEAEVGVQGHPDHDDGSVVFQVWVDGEKRFDSGLMRQSDAARAVEVDLRDCDEMELVVENGGDGIACDLANWANAVLVRQGDMAPRRSRNGLDVAPFARVMTWDSNQQSSHPGRVEELTAEKIFLGEELAPDDSGVYTAPAAADGRPCIGLQWYENRWVTELAVEAAEEVPAEVFENATVEWWLGESEWQGDWKPLQGAPVRDGARWVFRLAHEDKWDAKIGAQKVRWIFPETAVPVRIRRLEAYTRSQSAVAELRLEREAGKAGEEGRFSLYNGEMLAPDGSDGEEPGTWPLNAPLRLKVRYLKTRPGHAKSDRTVLRLELPDGAFGLAIEDVAEQGCVYVPDFGLFATLEPDGPTLEAYRNTLGDRHTVLEDVREMPDQSFAQAMEYVHREVQNNGPTMLSLACDNHKFTVYENAGVQHRHDHEIRPDQDRKKLIYDPKYPIQVEVKLNSARPKKETRSLEEDWMPILRTSYRDGDVVLRQRAYVAPFEGSTPAASPGWLNPKPLFVSEFTLENRSGTAAEVSLDLDFRLKGEKEDTAAPVRTVPQGAIAYAEDALLAFVDVSDAASFTVSGAEGRLAMQGSLAPGAVRQCTLYLPGWDANIAECASLSGCAPLDERVKAYWHALLSGAMQLELPDALLEDVIYAAQVHCLMLARNEMEAQCVAPWCGADRYGPLESESQAIIHGMSLMGHDDFAQRSLDYFIRRYNEDGLLTTGYTLMGVGWHLWTLADYYAIHKDEAWLKSVAPKLERACQWIVGECEKTKRLRPDGSRVPEYGLVSPGVAADWSRFAYLSRSEGEYYAGLMGVARCYADIGYPGGEALVARAGEFLEAIRRSYTWTQARSPVVQLRNGVWIPYSPAMMECFGRVMDIYPHEDGERSWAKDMSMGAHNLVVLGVLDDRDRRCVAWIADYLEDFWCVQGGMGAYPLEETSKDWFNLGGFSKVQPYYTRLVEMHALMDDVKPFIRAYFNAMPSLLNTENLNFWEHFGNAGAWDKPHETGWFLAQTRMMLVMERGAELWLAPFVTTHWMEDGMSVRVGQAPTRFGEVSYVLTSHVDQGYLEAVVEPPTRSAPQALVLRMRHPQEKPIQSVTVNGEAYSDFDPEREIIRLPGGSGELTVRACY